MYVLRDDGKKIWDGKKLHDLMIASGLSLDDISAETGVKVGSIRAYMAGAVIPSLNVVTKFSDFFNISIDEMVGRKESPELMKYLEGDHKNIVEAVKRKYKRKADKVGISFTDGAMASWPYNFLEEVFGVWEGVLDADQEAGLKMKLDELPERDRDIVLKYYRDKRTLKSIGDEYGVSRERIRQKVRKNAQRFRHPAVAQYIQFGAEGVKRRRDLSDKEKEISAQEVCLLMREKYVEDISRKIEEKIQEVEELRKKVREQESEEVGALLLSTRAETCIRRKGIKTIDELIDFAKSGDLRSVRNIGNKTAEEICQKIEDYCGLDFRRENGL